MPSDVFSNNVNDVLESAAEFLQWVSSTASSQTQQYLSKLQKDMTEFYANISDSNQKAYSKIKDIINSDNTGYERLKEGSKEVILALIENLRHVDQLVWKYRGEAAAIAIFVPVVGKLVSPIILCTSVMIYALSKVVEHSSNPEEEKMPQIVRLSNNSYANNLWEKVHKIDIDKDQYISEENIRNDKQQLIKLSKINTQLLSDHQSLDNLIYNDQKLLKSKSNSDKVVNIINSIKTSSKEAYNTLFITDKQISLPSKILQKYIVTDNSQIVRNKTTLINHKRSNITHRLRSNTGIRSKETPQPNI